MRQRLLIILLSALCFSQAFALTGKTERWKLSNGTQVVFHRAVEVPMLDINIGFAAGSAQDGKDYGLSALTTSLIAEGNGSLSANEVADAFAKTGAQFQAESSRDMAMVHLRTLTASAALADSILNLKRVLNQPLFQSADVARQKKQMMMLIQQNKESPDDVINDLFFSTLYAHHPYGHPIYGNADTVNLLNQDKVKRFYKQYWTGRNAVVVLVGAIDNKQAHQIAESLMGTLPSGQETAMIPEEPPLTESKFIQQSFPASQTAIRFGQTGITHHNPDYFPLIVGNYILGGGTLVSRLGHEIREKRGLSYGVTSQFIPMPGVGPFMIGFETKNNQKKEAIRVMQDTLKQFMEQGPTPAEVLAAKQYLTGHFNVSLSSNKAITDTLLRMAFYRLPDDYLEHYIQNIEQVDVDAIRQAFSRLLHPEKMLLIEVGS